MMDRFRTLILAVIVVLFGAASAQAGWADALSKVKEAVESSDAKSTGTSTAASDLTAAEIVNGLKTALDQAVGTAVSSLGAKDGFLGNLDVKIPVPESLTKVESGLRMIGQSDLADAFVTSMNRAAEQAVPETVDVLGEAIRKMSIADGRAILNGGDTAATQYFKKTSDDALFTRFKPIVTQAMERVDVTRHYQNMTSTAQATGLMSAESGLDNYVTRKALDGFYLIMEQEERNIRKNPVARTSEILQKVFGSL